MAPNDIESRLSQLKALTEMGLADFNYEAILERHYRNWVRNGDTVIDIGAHIGRHLLPLSQCVGTNGLAIGVEPLPFAFETLREKFVGPNVTLINAAIGRSPGRTSFTYAQGTPEESGLRQRTYNLPDQANPTLIEVNVETLDRITARLSEVSFIKIDIEGGEIDCLGGGLQTLKRLRPVLSVEYGFPSYSAYGHTKDTLFNFATSQDYLLYDVFLNPLKTIFEWRSACDYLYWDYFMVPVEKEAEFLERVRRPRVAPTFAPAPPWTVGRVVRGVARRIKRLVR
jgi:FkbM family methyltransferase